MGSLITHSGLNRPSLRGPAKKPRNGEDGERPARIGAKHLKKKKPWAGPTWAAHPAGDSRPIKARPTGKTLLDHSKTSFVKCVRPGRGKAGATQTIKKAEAQGFSFLLATPSRPVMGGLAPWAPQAQRNDNADLDIEARRTKKGY